MKRAGISTPASGWRQRTSASTPSRLLGAEVDDRLVLEKELLLRERPADVGLEPQALVQHVLHLRLEGDVPVLARGLGVVHRDVGVAEQRLGAGSRPSRTHADAGGDAHLHAVERNGRSSVSMSASASRSTSARVAMPSTRTANSSPPSRATVSEERVVLTMRCATACSSRSPASWPSESLMFLKLSRSRNMTATELCPRCARVSACCTRSRNRLRFASSVSGSWNASCRSCSSSALRSLMSRKFSASPCTAGSCVRLLPTLSITQRFVRPFDAQLHRTDGAGSARRDLGQESAQLLAVLPDPQQRQALAGDLLGLQSERALGSGRGEAQQPLRVDDHDDVGGIRDQRGVALLDQRAARRSRTSASPRSTTAWRTMSSSVSANTIMVITRRRAADVAAAEIHQHQERRQHRRIGQRRASASEVCEPVRAAVAGCASARARRRHSGTQQHRYSTSWNCPGR